MPIYEFDRIASDMTLNEIVAARLKKKLWAKIAQRAGGGMKTSGPFDPVIAAKLRKLRQSLTSVVNPKPPVTHMKRSVLLKRITEFTTRLDKIIDGPGGEKKVTEFALLPAIAGGIIGSGVGSRLTGKKLNPITGKWEDAQGNATAPPAVSSAVGAVAGAGAGLGVSKLHGSVMDAYGGAGGMKEAYRNLTRNAATQAGEKVSDVIGPKATTAIQDVHGIAKAEAGMAAENIAKKLKVLRGAGTAALKKVFGAHAPRHFVEFETRIDAIVFADKKKANCGGTRVACAAGTAASTVTEFDGGYVRTNRGVEKEPGVKGHLKRHAGVYIGSTLGSPTFPVGTAVGYYIDVLRKRKNILQTAALAKKKKEMSSLSRLVEFAQPNEPKKRSILKPLAIGAGLGAGTIIGIRAAGPVKAMAGGALEGLRARLGRKAAGVRIPPEKVHDFLMKLHKAAKA